MHERKLGRGLQVSAVGLGAVGISQSYRADSAGRDAMIDVLRGAVGQGVTFFDSTDLPGSCLNEDIVGEALGQLRQVRDDLVIAAKFGRRIEDGRSVGLDSRPEQITGGADASLKRLGVEVIDLLYQYRVDPDVPIEDVAGTVGELVAAGKVRHFGLCNVSAATIRRAQAVHPVSAVQSKYSLGNRDLEPEVLSACAELGIGFVPFNPVGEVFATGAASPGPGLVISDVPGTDTRFTAENHRTRQDLVDQVGRLAATKDATPGQVALAWLLAQQAWIVPIPGARHAGQIAENVAATTVALSADEIAHLNKLTEPRR